MGKLCPEGKQYENDSTGICAPGAAHRAALALGAGLPVGFWRGRRHLPAGRSAAPELSCHGCGSRPCRHPDQLQPDRALSGAYHAGWYQKLAAKAGAGSLVPITGFANAVVSAAIEFKAEGRVLGTGAKMFTIAGPVIVYGTLAAVVYGAVLWVLGMAGVPVLS